MAILDNPRVQGEKVKEGLGALRVFLRAGSRVKIVLSFAGVHCGLAEEHSIVYTFSADGDTRRRIVPLFYCRHERSIQAFSERRGSGEQVLGVFLIMRSWFERPQSFWSLQGEPNASCEVRC